MSTTRITDEYELEGYNTFQGVKYVRAKHMRRLEHAANAMEEALDSILGEASFEGLPETKQSDIHAALAQYRKLKP